MVDIKDHLDEETTEVPRLMDRSDIRPNGADGSCLFCRRLKREKGEEGGRGQDNVALFDNFNDIPLDEATNCGNDPHFCVLCPVEVNAFVFKTRQWGKAALATSWTFKTR